jgi:WS/DGAT/MGAT family acyltransferase
MFRMNGADAFLLAAETPRSYQHTLKIGILDPSGEPGGWSFEQYRSAVLSRLGISPIFRWKLAPSPLGFNHPMWIDDPDFEIDHHLKHVACPAPGDQRALCELISSLYADQLDRSRPLWKCWIIEGLEGGKVAQVTIIHHAYADGAAASHILQQFFSTELGAEPPTSGGEWRPPASPSWFKRLLLDIRDWPKVMLYYLPKAISGLMKKRKLESSARKSGQAPHPNAGMMKKTPINKVLGHGRTFVCDSFPLADIKGAGKPFGATINDVFLSCSAGALRRYLKDADYDPTEPLVAGTPLSQERPLEKAGLGNFATADYSWLHAEISDPVERLMASHRSANEMKAHAAASKGADLGTIVALLPPWSVKCLHWLVRRNAGATGMMGNVILSNVPGPRAPLYLNHTRLDNWFSTGQVFEGSSLNMTLWSYCENANLCILADKKAVPDGWVLFNYFMEELQILIDAAKQQTQDNSEEKIA